MFKTKCVIGFTCLVLLGGSIFPLKSLAEEQSKITLNQWDPETTCTKRIKLSAAQKKQLDKIYWKIYHDYSQLIDAYAWMGALDSNQAKLRHKMLKNYYTTFYNKQYQWCSEFESDEWEEEWYNNDND